MTQTFEQDPNEILDYTIDYRSSGQMSPALQEGESIVASVWSVQGTVALGTNEYAPTYSATATSCWIRSGSIPSDSKITNRITTDSSPARVFERSFIVKVVDK